MMICWRNYNNENPIDPQMMVSQGMAGLTVTDVVGNCDETSCCQVFEDPTASCAVGSGTGTCYCDALCFQMGDCCDDIGNNMSMLEMLQPCTSCKLRPLLLTRA